jgi:hypothetical protein
MSTSLKRRIQSLERQGGSAREAQIKKQQVSAASHRFPWWHHFLTSVARNQKTALVKSKFVEAIQSYQQVEQQYRQKYKQRMERQFRIGATPYGTLFVFVHLRRGSCFQSSPTRHQKKSVLSSMIAKADRYSLKLCGSSFLFVN